MALIDINKKSLPEQVQENKEKIADLESTTATKTYVDDQDAATLGLAKAYADGKDATTLQSAKDYADLAAAGALGDAKTYADSGLALKQNVLTDSSVSAGTIDDAIGFDTDGNLVKGTVGGSGKTLLWSGNYTINSGNSRNITIDGLNNMPTGTTFLIEILPVNASIERYYIYFQKRYDSSYSAYLLSFDSDSTVYVGTIRTQFNANTLTISHRQIGKIDSSGFTADASKGIAIATIYSIS